jgi:hypothetical protein
MDADKQTVKNLQDSAQRLASLAGQYQIDVRWLKALGLGWLACYFKKWYGSTEDQLRIFVDRLLYIEAPVSYQAGKVTTPDDLATLLSDREKTVYDILDAFKDYRKASWDIEADYTPDIYEHAIRELEKQAVKLARERKLLEKLTEPGYIGARLEDE